MWTVKNNNRTIYSTREWSIKTLVQWLAKREKVAQKKIVYKAKTLYQVEFSNAETGDYIASAEWDSNG